MIFKQQSMYVNRKFNLQHLKLCQNGPVNLISRIKQILTHFFNGIHLNILIFYDHKAYEVVKSGYKQKHIWVGCQQCSYFSMLHHLNQM